jgi:antitoxin (DNA-binding transcriptional repressor) of toxin-antitoxin stability system
MKAVGIRELKNRLSEYVRLVKSGETVLVTDRGAIVAELRPPGEARHEGLNPVIDALIRRGNVKIGAPNRPDLYPSQRSVKPGTAAKLLDAEREER